MSETNTNAAHQFPHLKLENQLCFPFYAASMLITRKYQPLLDALGLTYPQYLVLLVLWENNGLTVGQIASALLLNTNTVTPLLKRMEKQGFIERIRSETDERQVMVHLTNMGTNLREKASEIPFKLIEGVDYPIEKANALRHEINLLIEALSR